MVIERTSKGGETFSETVSRAVRWFIVNEAKREISALREMTQEMKKPCVTVTVEDVEKRRENARVSSVSLASNPSVVARPCGATHDKTGQGQTTEKIENFASPSGSAARSADESAGKLEQFPEDLENSQFFLGVEHTQT